MESIPGLEDSPLNDIAGMWVWIGFIICGVGLAVGAMLFGYGRIKHKSGFTASGAIAMPIALIGAVVLGNMNGAIKWSSTDEYTMAALPKDAQTRSITVEKNPPKVTCSEPIKYEQASWKMDDESKAYRKKLNELWPKLVSDEDAAKHPEVLALEYSPQGPDCTKSNTVPQQCTTVNVWAYDEAMNPKGHISQAMDPKKFEYQSRGSKDC